MALNQTVDMTINSLNIRIKYSTNNEDDLQYSIGSLSPPTSTCIKQWCYDFCLLSL